jgi:hypothetical protein
MSAMQTNNLKNSLILHFQPQRTLFCHCCEEPALSAVEWAGIQVFYDEWH